MVIIIYSSRIHTFTNSRISEVTHQFVFQLSWPCIFVDKMKTRVPSDCCLVLIKRFK
uniref:Uncharacterized protein n=1 Tax=Arundo donax TaxID=35708 RepID=A0A0A9FSM8_ARUDO